MCLSMYVASESMSMDMLQFTNMFGWYPSPQTLAQVARFGVQCFFTTNILELVAELAVVNMQAVENKPLHNCRSCVNAASKFVFLCVGG